jgi:hypothetical protein
MQWEPYNANFGAWHRMLLQGPIRNTYTKWHVPVLLIQGRIVTDMMTLERK